MLKTVFSVLLVLVIAIGAGAASVHLALDAARGIGSVTIGEWTTFPDAGTDKADPYSRARFAREGGLSLGRAEGIAFVAVGDSQGLPLRRECSYLLEGVIPAARFWTLYAADAKRTPLPSVGRRKPALHSRMLLRKDDGAVTISISSRPMPGNWLVLAGSGPMQLILTLFDTPVSTEARVEDMALPRLKRTGCDA